MKTIPTESKTAPCGCEMGEGAVRRPCPLLAAFLRAQTTAAGNELDALDVQIREHVVPESRAA